MILCVRKRRNVVSVIVRQHWNDRTLGCTLLEASLGEGVYGKSCGNISLIHRLEVWYMFQNSTTWQRGSKLFECHLLRALVSCVGDLLQEECQVLLMHESTHKRHINSSICGQVLLKFNGNSKPIYLLFIINISNLFCFLLCMNYVNKFAFIFALEMWQVNSFALNLMLIQWHWTHQESVRVHWICVISLTKGNAHLLTYNYHNTFCQPYFVIDMALCSTLYRLPLPNIMTSAHFIDLHYPLSWHKPLHKLSVKSSHRCGPINQPIFISA